VRKGESDWIEGKHMVKFPHNEQHNNGGNNTKMRVLIVEDEAIIALDLKYRLRKLGHEVVACADTGEDAIQYACDMQPDLVLMDVQLKGPIDGIQAACQISECVNIPVIFTTAQSDLATEEQIAGARPLFSVGFLNKPFADHTLQEIMGTIAGEYNRSWHRLEAAL
jgi:CheY-like chemotaxis protein